MKLETGMYVRTDRGIIGKIYEKIGDMFTYEDSNRDYITYGLTHNEILKASFNLIDLIEVGDFVNGCRVIEKILKEKAEDNLIRLTTKESARYGVRINELELHIKSILTHEQYEANCYKVVE